MKKKKHLDKLSADNRLLAQLPQLRGLLHFFAWVFDKSGQLILNIA